MLLRSVSIKSAFSYSKNTYGKLPSIGVFIKKTIVPNFNYLILNIYRFNIFYRLDISSKFSEFILRGTFAALFNTYPNKTNPSYLQKNIRNTPNALNALTTSKII